MLKPRTAQLQDQAHPSQARGFFSKNTQNEAPVQSPAAASKIPTSTTSYGPPNTAPTKRRTGPRKCSACGNPGHNRCSIEKCPARWHRVLNKTSPSHHQIAMPTTQQSTSSTPVTAGSYNAAASMMPMAAFQQHVLQLQPQPPLPAPSTVPCRLQAIPQQCGPFYAVSFSHSALIPQGMPTQSSGLQPSMNMQYVHGGSRNHVQTWPSPRCQTQAPQQPFSYLPGFTNYDIQVVESMGPSGKSTSTELHEPLDTSPQIPPTQTRGDQGSAESSEGIVTPPHGTSTPATTVSPTEAASAPATESKTRTEKELASLQPPEPVELGPDKWSARVFVQDIEIGSLTAEKGIKLKKPLPKVTGPLLGQSGFVQGNINISRPGKTFLRVGGIALPEPSRYGANPGDLENYILCINRVEPCSEVRIMLTNGICTVFRDEKQVACHQHESIRGRSDLTLNSDGSWDVVPPQEYFEYEDWIHSVKEKLRDGNISSLKAFPKLPKQINRCKDCIAYKNAANPDSTVGYELGGCAHDVLKFIQYSTSRRKCEFRTILKEARGLCENVKWDCIPNEEVRSRVLEVRSEYLKHIDWAEARDQKEDMMEDMRFESRKKKVKLGR